MRQYFILLIGILVLGAVPAKAEDVCAGRLHARLPVRDNGAVTGSEFARRVEGMTESEREDVIRAELLDGNIPSFVRGFVPVTMDAQRASGRIAHLTFCVLSDYLAVGSDRDFLYVPMRLATALAIASRYGFTLPTSKQVDAIYAEATVKLAPQPLPASDLMRTTAYYVRHNAMIHEQRAALGIVPGKLTAGHKKDLVVTSRLWNFLDRVAIYGWHRGDDDPIQHVSTVHGAHYADYSHGVRLVSDRIIVDGVPMATADALTDPDLSAALTEDGGPIQNLSQLLAMLAQPKLALQ